MIAIHRLRPPLRRWQCVSAGAVLLLAAMQADAQTSPRDNAFTVHGGFRDGGSFVDTATDRKVRLDGSGMFAASLDLGLDGTRQLQFHVSQQQSDLQLSSATGASSGTTRLPLTVTYLHLGGTNFFDGPIGRGPYVLGGIGATLLRPGRASTRPNCARRSTSASATSCRWAIGSRCASRRAATSRWSTAAGVSSATAAARCRSAATASPKATCRSACRSASSKCRDVNITPPVRGKRRRARPGR
jgi:hypothetical protein